MPFTETSRVTFPFFFELVCVDDRGEERGSTIETVMMLGLGMETDPFMFVPSLPGMSEIMISCNSKPLRPSIPFPPHKG